jgi:hypothetical protein
MTHKVPRAVVCPRAADRLENRTAMDSAASWTIPVALGREGSTPRVPTCSYEQVAKRSCAACRGDPGERMTTESMPSRMIKRDPPFATTSSTVMSMLREVADEELDLGGRCKKI